MLNQGHKNTPIKRYKYEVSFQKLENTQRLQFIYYKICMLNALLKMWQKGYDKGITDCFKYSGIFFLGGETPLIEPL